MTTALSPAGAGKVLGGYVSKAPEEASPEVRGLISTVARFKACKSYSALKASLDQFDNDCAYDTPFMYIHGRDRIRAICSVFSVFGATMLDPKVLRIYDDMGDKRITLDFDATGYYAPTRTWWVPPSLLLPSRVPHETTLTLSIKSWSDKVDKVKERFHNLPALPFILRWLAGQGLGTVLTVLEPAALAAFDLYEKAWVNISSTTSSVADVAASTIGHGGKQD